MSTESLIDLESSVKLPYVRENVILMSPGTWNGLVYSAQENNRAVNLTDWSDRERSSLFLDHEDTGAKEWIGEIKNPTVDETGVVTGDMFVVDKATAVKLAYGAHFGISPKTGGQDIEGTMCNYSFLNFSVVFNPAVKTAYINNSQIKEKPKMVESKILISQELAQVTDMEATRERMGLSVSQFYAIPRDPPSASKLPIFDKAHTQNAMARFNQVKEISSTERATAKKKILSAAKKFGIKVSDDFKKLQEEQTMAEEEKKPEETAETKEEVSTEVKKEATAEAPKVEATEVAPEPEKKEEEPVDTPPAAEDATAELSDTLKAISSKVDKIYDAVAKLLGQKPAEPEKKEEKPAETTQKMTEAVKKLEEPAIPDKLGQKATEPAQKVEILSAEQMTSKLDEQMAIMMLKRQETGGIE